jgi:hypothetical protein
MTPMTISTSSSTRMTTIVSSKHSPWDIADGSNGEAINVVDPLAKIRQSPKSR